MVRALILTTTAEYELELAKLIFKPESKSRVGVVIYGTDHQSGLVLCACGTKSSSTIHPVSSILLGSANHL